MGGRAPGPGDSAAEPGALTVVVSDRQRDPLPDAQAAALAALAHETLVAEGVDGGELSLSFVDAYAQHTP